MTEVVVARAGNAGSRSVTLDQPYILLPDRLELTPINLFLTGSDPFPAEVWEGERCRAIISAASLAYLLRKAGCSAPVYLQVGFQDQVGRRYESEGIMFDPMRFAAGPQDDGAVSSD